MFVTYEQLLLQLLLLLIHLLFLFLLLLPLFVFDRDRRMSYLSASQQNSPQGSSR